MKPDEPELPFDFVDYLSDGLHIARDAALTLLAAGILNLSRSGRERNLDVEPASSRHIGLTKRRGTEP